jgi:hypothetical protein
MFTYSYRESRPVTSELLDNLEEGLYDKDQMIADLLGWMSERDVAEFARANEYILAQEEEDEEDEEEEDEDDGQPDEAQEWESFDADC